MIILKILLWIIGAIYVLLLCITTKFLYDEYKKGKPIPFFPKGSDIIEFLCFPVYIPFAFLSLFRDISNKKKYKVCKESVLVEVFDNNYDKLNQFEQFIASKSGIFHESFYSVLDRIKDFKESEISNSTLHDMVSEQIQMNGIETKKTNQIAFDILYSFYKNKYNESHDQVLNRLRKAGYNVRSTQLSRDESKHQIKCEFEGNEDNCTKDCESCVISLKTSADSCLLQKNYNEAIEKYSNVLKEEPNFAEAWNNLASAYGSIGNHSLALEAYLKAIDIDPEYGKALWGAAMALKNLGRNGEARAMLLDLLKYYNFDDANEVMAEYKEKKVTPISVCRNLEKICYKQISLIAKIFGLEHNDNFMMSNVAKAMFEELFSPFIDYLFDYYDEININKLSKVASKFMFLAGMASSKLYYNEKEKIASVGIVKLLSSTKGFFAMDEYCCDYLGIKYVPDKDNALSPCVEQMTLEANRIYSDIINQVQTVPQIKILLHDISMSFYAFGFNYVEDIINRSNIIDIQPKCLTKKDILALRLKTLANEPVKKTIKDPDERSAMCYSISLRTPEDEAIKCEHCGKIYFDVPGNESENSYCEEIRKLGYDCKLERWCRDCCIKYGFNVKEHEKSCLVFFIKLESSDDYRMSIVSWRELMSLYQFFKTEKGGEVDRVHFDAESIKTVERILEINVE